MEENMKLCRVKLYVTVWRHSACTLVWYLLGCDPLVMSVVGCFVTTVDVNIKSLREVTPCGLVDRYRHFGETFFCHLQGFCWKVLTVAFLGLSGIVHLEAWPIL